MKNGILKQKNNTVYSAAGKGVIIALLMSVVCALVGAVMLNKEILSEESTFIMALITWAIAAFVGSASSSHFFGAESILPVLITNAVYAMVLIGIGILFFESNFGNVIGAFLAFVAGCIPSILILINKKPKKYKKIRYKA